MYKDIPPPPITCSCACHGAVTNTVGCDEMADLKKRIEKLEKDLEELKNNKSKGKTILMG